MNGENKAILTKELYLSNEKYLFKLYPKSNQVKSIKEYEQWWIIDRDRPLSAFYSSNLLIVSNSSFAKGQFLKANETYK